MGEKKDIERLLDPYGSIIEVRIYAKQATAKLHCSRDKAQQAVKDLDQSCWMDNKIRVKFDEFETNKEKSWFVGTQEGRMPGNSTYAHCERITNNVIDEDMASDWYKEQMNTTQFPNTTTLTSPNFS